MTTKYINLIAQQYLGSGYAAHSLRASYVTVSKLNGADDSKVINQTKHNTSAMIRRYTKLDNVRLRWSRQGGQKKDVYFFCYDSQKERGV
ncbi:hypothetical protein LJ738_21170, partial [Hymenobacter sp. BT770]|nr:hypothetical protein [Hymenobacter sp. BT770]